MKLYELDMGWEGYAICIANNKTEAIKIISENHSRCDKDDLTEIIEHEIVRGKIIVGYGDS